MPGDPAPIPLRQLTELPFSVDLWVTEKGPGHARAIVVACKTTYRLSPGTTRPISPLPIRHEPEITRGRLVAPADLVPHKPSPEVVLGGEGEAVLELDDGTTLPLWPWLPPAGAAIWLPAHEQRHLADPQAFGYAPPPQRLRELPITRSFRLTTASLPTPLATRLTTITPFARLELVDATSHPIELIPELWWLDPARHLCTVTWRGSCPLEPSSDCAVAVGHLEAMRTMDLPAALSGRFRQDALAQSLDDGELPTTRYDDDEDPPTPAPPPRPSPAAGRPAAPPRPRAQTATMVNPMPAVSPTWVAKRPTSAPPRPAPGAPPAPRPSAPPPVARVPSTPPPPAPPPAPPPPARPPSPPPIARALAPRGPIVPNPLAASAPPRVALTPPPAATSKPKQVPKPVDGPIALLWHDPEGVAELRADEDLRDRAVDRPAIPAHDVDLAGPMSSGDEDADFIVELLRSVPPARLVDLPRELRERLKRAQRPVTPLVIVSGKVQFRFAPRDKLQTYVDTARPLARHDKRLAAILESAEEVLGTPLAELPSVAESQRLEVAEAWRRANRELEDDFLDESARRLLLRRRAFDRRRVLDSLHLRGSLSDGEHEVVIYVPEPTAKRLPITSELNGIAICRLLGRQDEQEKASTALFALALGQVVTH